MSQNVICFIYEKMERGLFWIDEKKANNCRKYEHWKEDAYENTINLQAINNRRAKFKLL